MFGYYIFNIAMWLKKLAKSIKKNSHQFYWRLFGSEPAGTRTQGPYIKSVLLYQLSYEFNPLRLTGRQK